MPSRLNAFAAKTTNVSRVIAKIAGIESIANITSNAATMTSAASSGVAGACRRRCVNRRSPSYSLGERHHAPQRAHREGLSGSTSSPPWRAIFTAVNEQQRAEHVRRRVERVERRGAGEMNSARSTIAPATPQHEHAPALRRRHREEREQHREDEQVVERQRLLDQEAGEVLARRPSPSREQQHAGERRRRSRSTTIDQTSAVRIDGARCRRPRRSTRGRRRRTRRARAREALRSPSSREAVSKV